MTRKVDTSDRAIRVITEAVKVSELPSFWQTKVVNLIKALKAERDELQERLENVDESYQLDALERGYYDQG